MLATIVGRNLIAHKLRSRETLLAAPWAPQPQLHLLSGTASCHTRRTDRVLIASMAETYARMDKSSADGMKTADAAVAAVVEGWARVRDDSSSVEWVVYALEGKTYKLAAEGSGRPELARGAGRGRGQLCGLLDGPPNARKFYHLLYVGADVGIIKRNKAQLQKKRGVQRDARRGRRGPAPCRRQDAGEARGAACRCELPKCRTVAVVASAATIPQGRRRYPGNSSARSPRSRCPSRRRSSPGTGRTRRGG